VTRKSVQEYLAAQRERYARGSRVERTRLLDEIAAVTPNVSARTRQAGNYPGLDRVAGDYYDRDISCSLLCRQGAGDVERHDHVDLEPDKLGREPRKLIQLLPRSETRMRCFAPPHSHVRAVLRGVPSCTNPRPRFLC